MLELSPACNQSFLNFWRDQSKQPKILSNIVHSQLSPLQNLVVHHGAAGQAFLRTYVLQEVEHWLAMFFVWCWVCVRAFKSSIMVSELLRANAVWITCDAGGDRIKNPVLVWNLLRRWGKHQIKRPETVISGKSMQRYSSISTKSEKPKEETMLHFDNFPLYRVNYTPKDQV